MDLPLIFIEILAAAALALTTVLVHYETLRGTSVLLPRLRMTPRPRILISICIVLVAHTFEITLYALTYDGLHRWLDMGPIEGQPATDFYDYLYYSLTSYTTLGVGDMYPARGLRLLSGSEALVGLVMITWSASFTYLAMQKFWTDHASHRQGGID
jgi:hypothetical protein